MTPQIAHLSTQDGTTLAYDDTGGAGPVLLCLPGLTRNRADFDPVLAHFADRARIIRLDFRGRGASSHADPATYTPFVEAGDVIALLDHLGLERACVLGTSRGGLVALILAKIAPARLSGVIFNDIGPEIMPEGLAKIMTYIGKRPKFKTLDEAALAMPALNTGFHGVSPAQWRAHVEALWQERSDGLHLRYDPRLRDAVARAFDPDAPAPDLWPLFDALGGLPLGLIRGAQSDILSPATAQEMRRRRPDLAYAELPDRGHVPFLDEPQARAVIAAILEQVP